MPPTSGTAIATPSPVRCGPGKASYIFTELQGLWDL